MQLITTIAIAIMVASSVGAVCAAGHNNATAISEPADNAIYTGKAVNPQYQKFIDRKYPDNSGNFDAGQFQSISGKFNGETVDTITLFPFDGEHDDGFEEFYYEKWILISKYGAVPSTIVESYWPQLVYEGDLDGNGTDEFGVTGTGLSSCWVSYYVYTLSASNVKLFTEVSWYQCNDDDLNIICSRGSKKGEVIVNSYEMIPGVIQMSTSKRRITKFLR